MVILLIITSFQLLSIDTTDIFTISIIFKNMKKSFDTSFEKLTILNVFQQWTSTEFS